MPTRPRFLSREGRILTGEQRLIQVAQPAAASEWSVQVPGGLQWRLLGGQAVLTTSANVGNRFPTLQVTVGGAVVFASINTATVAASSSATLVMQKAYGPNGSAQVGGIRVLDAPDIWLPQSSVVASGPSGLLAADQFSAITLLVEEVWFDNQSLTDEYDLIMAALQKTGGGQ